MRQTSCTYLGRLTTRRANCCSSAAVPSTPSSELANDHGKFHGRIRLSGDDAGHDDAGDDDHGDDDDDQHHWDAA